jgi:hypothetical protein
MVGEVDTEYNERLKKRLAEFINRLIRNDSLGAVCIPSNKFNATGDSIAFYKNRDGDYVIWLIQAKDWFFGKV